MDEEQEQQAVVILSEQNAHRYVFMGCDYGDDAMATAGLI